MPTMYTYIYIHIPFIDNDIYICINKYLGKL